MPWMGLTVKLAFVGAYPLLLYATGFFCDEEIRIIRTGLLAARKVGLRGGIRALIGT